MSEKIFEDDEVSVYFSAAGGKTAILSYSSMRHDFATKGIPALGMMESYGYDTFGIIARRDNWYPVVSMQAVAQVLRTRLAPYHRRLAYGSSMGAYGAIKHSARLGCDFVLALAPQYTIDPKQVGDWDGRYHTNFRAELNTGMEIVPQDLGGQITVIADPFYKMDMRHAAHIATLGAVNIVPGSGCEHLVIQPLAGREVMGRFLQALMVGDHDRAKAIYRQSRKASPYYRGVMLMYLAQRYINRHDSDAAAHAVEASIAAYDRHPQVFLAASKIHTLRKDYNKALEAALEAQKRDPNSAWVARVVNETRQRTKVAAM